MAAPQLDDENFAQLLLRICEQDRARLADAESTAASPSIAVWMAEELRRHADELNVSKAVGDQVRAAAHSLRTAGSEARKKRSAQSRTPPAA